MFNTRGACLAGAITTPDLMPSVVHLATGAWHRAAEPTALGLLELNGNPNVLTRDVGRRLSVGGLPLNLFLFRSSSIVTATTHRQSPL